MRIYRCREAISDKYQGMSHILNMKDEKNKRMDKGKSWTITRREMTGVCAPAKTYSG
jgi:hypothetical protein